MKKLLLFFALPALLFASCSDSDTDETKHEQILKAGTPKLTFPSEGETLTFELTAKNVEWKLTASNDWIDYDQTAEKEVDNGATVHTIEVTLGEGPDDGRNGKLTISAPGVDDVVVEIVQKENPAEPKVFHWETNSLSRMNLHGKVKSASLHNNFIHENYMADLEFDQNGWITSFVHTTRIGDKVTNTILYDSDYRVSKLEGQFENGQYSTAEFTYGDDSRYISMEELFYFIMLDLNADLMAWFPQYVKGLEKISVRCYDGVTYEFVIDPDAGTAIQHFSEEENTFIWDMTFSGDLPTGLMADNWGDVKVTIDIDEESGKLVSYRTDDDWGWSLRNHNLNRSNSAVELRSDWQEVDYGYNENFDLVTINDLLRPASSKSFSYTEYDESGNWTSMNETGGVTYSRSVTYW